MASGVTFEPMLPPGDVYAGAASIDTVQATSNASDTLKDSSLEFDSAMQAAEGSQEAHFWPKMQKLVAGALEQARADLIESQMPLIVKVVPR